MKPPHHGAYDEIYKLSVKNIINARHDIENIGETYQKPLDYNCYDDTKYRDNDENEIDLDEMSTFIDYDRLLIDPSSERYQLEEMMKNNERFNTAIKKFKTSTKELRTINAKTKVELDVAWHSYYLSSSTSSRHTTTTLDLDDKKINYNDMSEDGYEYNMNSDLEMDSEYLELMKKVNKPGPLQKRFSII